MRDRRRRCAPARAVALAAAVAVAALLAAGLAGCGADGGDEGTLTVFAASSLTEPFTELADVFEEQHPGTEVRLSFAGSSDLATQIEAGAPADVFASANPAQVERVVHAGLAQGEPEAFAANTLQIAVPSGNPAGVISLADLAGGSTGGDVDLVVCAPQVPCGDATVRLADAAGIELSPVSEEPSVTSVLDKVRTGEADAGLVYVSDVAGAEGAVEGIEVPEAAAIVNRYEVVLVAEPDRGAAGDELAEAFVDLVVEGDGRAVLAESGFAPP